MRIANFSNKRIFLTCSSIKRLIPERNKIVNEFNNIDYGGTTVLGGGMRAASFSPSSGRAPAEYYILWADLLLCTIIWNKHLELLAICTHTQKNAVSRLWQGLLDATSPSLIFKAKGIAMSMNHVLLKIKRLALQRRLKFTFKAECEMLRSYLSEDDIIEALVKGPAIKK